MLTKNISEEFIKDVTWISNRLPKCKSIHIPKEVVNRLNLEDQQYVYLIINRFIHPVVYVKKKITIPIKLRRMVEHDKDIKISIKPINTNKIFFLASFRPIRVKGDILYYYLYVHPLVQNDIKLKIFIKDKYLCGTSKRGRVGFGKRIFKKLDLEPFKTHQFIAEIDDKKSNNKHLFENSLNLNLKDCIKKNRIILPKLLPDFKIKDLGKQIEVFYETKCKDSKKITINKKIRISSDLLRLLGLYQAEGTKTRTNYIDFANNDPNQIEYFKETFTEIFGISEDLWTTGVSTNRDKEKIKNFWKDLLNIDSNKIHVRFEERRKTIYGHANLKICNNTIREILYRILNLIKTVVIKDKDYGGFFLAGVLAGDGYLLKENSRIKRIELYFNPHKYEDETLFYINILKRLNIKNYFMAIYYQKDNLVNKEKSEKIVDEIKGMYKNVKSQPSIRLRGIGGRFCIHRKEDLNKLIPYKLFFPNMEHYKKFYG